MVFLRVFVDIYHLYEMSFIMFTVCFFFFHFILNRGRVEYRWSQDQRCQTPWSCSYRPPWGTWHGCWSQSPDPWKSSKSFKHWAVSAVLTIFFWDRVSECSWEGLELRRQRQSPKHKLARHTSQGIEGGPGSVRAPASIWRKESNRGRSVSMLTYTHLPTHVRATSK